MTKKITFEVPDDFDPNQHQIPDGWKVVQPGKVGRPRADLKRIAVFLSRDWRTSMYGDTKAEAIEWICNHWRLHGIHDAARARARAKEGGDLVDMMRISHLPGGCICFKMPMKNGSRGWMWNHGLHEAVEIEATIEVGRRKPIGPISAEYYASLKAGG